MSESPPVNEVPEHRRRSYYWIVMGLLVAIYAVVGTFFVPDGNNVLSLLIGGLLLSQPLLFAFWAALAPQRFYHRFLWSLLLCSLVSFVEELGDLRNPYSHLGSTMLAFTAEFLVVTILLLVFRRLSRWHIRQLAAEETPSDYRPNQFGIRHLVILITITALACGLFKTLLMMNSNMDERFSSVAISVGANTVIFLLSLLPVLVIPWYTLACRGRVSVLILATIAILAVCDSVVYDLTIVVLAIDQSIIRKLLLSQLGAGLSVFFTTLVLRWCGYRMIREAKA